MRDPIRHFVAEFAGIFALVFVGGAALINAQARGSGTGLLEAAFAHGLILAVAVTATMRISGHFNPAVTLGFAAARRFPWRHVPAYVGAQVAGALGASLLHRLLYGADLAGRAQYGATAPHVPTGAAVGFEVTLTFLLMLVIMAGATDRRVPGAVPGLAIGLTVALCALF